MQIESAEISDEDWNATHASINSARCYEVAIAALRERWLKEQSMPTVEDFAKLIDKLIELDRKFDQEQRVLQAKHDNDTLLLMQNYREDRGAILSSWRKKP
jgi:hypothetical protein